MDAWPRRMVLYTVLMVAGAAVGASIAFLIMDYAVTGNLVVPYMLLLLAAMLAILIASLKLVR